MNEAPGSTAAQAVVELRTYLLRPGERAEYDRIFREEAGPLLERFGIDVVAYGPSVLDDDHYFLLRSFPSLAERDGAEDRFYGSDAWRNGPRESVISRIVSYHEVVWPATADTIDALRTALGDPSATPPPG